MKIKAHNRFVHPGIYKNRTFLFCVISKHRIVNGKSVFGSFSQWRRVMISRDESCLNEK